MDYANRYKITSDKFFDLIIEYNNDLSILQKYGEDSYLIINERYAVVFIPIENSLDNIVYNYGYNAVPSCYGLMSVPKPNHSGILATKEVEYSDLHGDGVLIGIIDTGVDYTNPALLYPDSTTRILSIWDQTIDSNDYPLGYYYGTEYTRETINLALRQSNPFSIVPSKDENGHGTALASVAGGTPNKNNLFSGIATNSNYVVVKLKEAKPALREFFRIPKDPLCYSCNDIMFGIRYLLSVAKRVKRPIVICIGVGTSQGSHEGLNELDQYISGLSKLQGTAFLIAAGNEGYDGHHFWGHSDSNIKSSEFLLNVANDESGFSMEFWGEAPHLYSIDIFLPSGKYLGTVPHVFQSQIKQVFTFDDTIVHVDSLIKKTISGSHLILFRFTNPVSGIWEFQINSGNEIDREFNVWLPISNFLTSNTYLFNSSPFISLTGPANTQGSITITAYDPVDENLYQNASKGYPRSKIIKPDVAAPGVNILTPTADKQYVSMSGTGIATAYATGVTALLMEWGIIRGNQTYLNSYGIRRLLTASATRQADQTYPNPCWGYGKLNLNSALLNANIYKAKSIHF